MKILFTGASSFTGYWFVSELARFGHEVTATFTGASADNYTGIRKTRVEKLTGLCRPVFGCEFGGTRFFNILSENRFDVLCHHAADVNDYKSPDFDIPAALRKNTNNIREVLAAVNHDSFAGIVVTGSVFEKNEGSGSKPLEAFSPYGLSKYFTYETIRYYAEKQNIRRGKFVIPNPFGPYEEQRFTWYLMKNWAEGKTPAVSAPDYVRDNIHVSLLAELYARFVSSFEEKGKADMKINPSGYTGTQGDFTRRVSAEISERLGLECAFILNGQTDFSEPLERINTDSAADYYVEWEERKSWDEFAEYYKKYFKL
jgi:nucleoside-diphosphate-sugar epimerase